MCALAVWSNHPGLPVVAWSGRGSLGWSEG